MMKVMRVRGIEVEEGRGAAEGRRARKGVENNNKNRWRWTEEEAKERQAGECVMAKDRGERFRRAREVCLGTSDISPGLYPTLQSPSVTETQRLGLTQSCQSSTELLITEICKGQIS